jgi:hypothetical protein
MSMMLTFGAPTITTISAGLYPAVLADVQLAEGVTGPYLVWSFEINTEGVEVALGAPTSVKVGPGTKARRYAETLLERPIREDETVPVQALHGARCMVLVTVMPRDGTGPVNRIENVLAPFPAHGASEGTL